MYSNTRAQQTETLESGHTYRLTQAKTRTVLDLSMKDWSSIRSTAWDASDNQKWVAERAESGSGGWTFRSVATGLFLSVEGTPRPNASVVATREVTTWDLHPARDPSTVRLVVFGAPLCVQVGSSGASVKLGDLREGGEAQQWRLEKGENVVENDLERTVENSQTSAPRVQEALSLH
ncbi:hypothetical protein TRAPUB_11535 [Trametes pubescens]|uniref:Ricin B lectin domain-containing protein n=1 Tax=Trametes pubescens TaxID=154538 RepID=A0A1M2VWA2_TRAPU|nr:hypothetical protein TRAPUB_11535 [Trametes pubescens]